MGKNFYIHKHFSWGLLATPIQAGIQVVRHDVHINM